MQATESELDTDSWRLYDYIARHFIGSVSPDCRFTKTRALFFIGGERFHCSGRATVAPGFTAIMPWLAVPDEGLPVFVVAENVPVRISGKSVRFVCESASRLAHWPDRLFECFADLLFLEVGNLNRTMLGTEVWHTGINCVDPIYDIA